MEAIVRIVYRSSTALGHVIGRAESGDYLVRVGDFEYVLPKSRLEPVSFAVELIAD